MTICTDHNHEVCYESRECPACEIKTELDEAKQEIEKLNEKIEELNNAE